MATRRFPVADKHRVFLRQQAKRYPELVALQGGERCAICGGTPKTRRLHIDHDHATMQLRGLLCHADNRRLWAGVTPERLRAMAAYLECPPLREVA